VKRVKRESGTRVGAVHCTHEGVSGSQTTVREYRRGISWIS